MLWSCRFTWVKAWYVMVSKICTWNPCRIISRHRSCLQVFQHGELFSDHERCTAIGHRVLRDGGSSVDAAIASALCLGVVHPHVSGVGGYVICSLLIADVTSIYKYTRKCLTFVYFLTVEEESCSFMTYTVMKPGSSIFWDLLLKHSERRCCTMFHRPR